VNNPLLSGLLTLAVAIVGGLGGWLAKRAPTVGSREMALIDQLQEDANQLRADAKRLSEVITGLETRERRLGDYIATLRLHIDTGQGPPAPPWPEGLI